MISIRDATAVDARAIAAVNVSSWREGYRGLMPADLLDGLSIDSKERGWAKLLRGGNPRTILAVDDRAVTGYATFARLCGDGDAPPEVAELIALYVDPPHWRHGIGAELLRESLDRLRRDGATEVTAWVLEGNQAASAFYARAGFAADGDRMAHEASGLDQIRYRARLTR